MAKKTYTPILNDKIPLNLPKVNIKYTQPTPQPARPTAPITRGNFVVPKNDRQDRQQYQSPSTKGILESVFDKENYAEKFKRGDVGGGVANLLGTVVTAPQSLYLNLLNAGQDVAKGKKPSFQYQMGYSDYEKKVADRQGTIPLSQKIENPLLQGAYRFGMEVVTDPLELTPIGFYNDIKLAKGVSQATGAYAESLQAGKLVPRVNGAKQANANTPNRPVQPRTPQNRTVVPDVAQTGVKQAENVAPVRRALKQSEVDFPDLPIKKANIKNEARNKGTHIEVGEKFEALSPEHQQSILVHENAHNLSNKHLFEDGKFQDILNNKAFGETKITSDGRTYWEGIFGDVGATSVDETLTEAIAIYKRNPEWLLERHPKAYAYIKNNVMSKPFTTPRNPLNRPVQPRNIEKVATVPIKEQTPVKKATPGKRDLGADIARPKQTLGEARTMYGTIEPGMEPRARDAQIPKAINGQPIQQGIRTSAEARAVNHESYQAILSAVEDGMAAKVTVKNQVAVENASKTIAEDGLDVAYGKFKSVLDGGKQAKSEDIALGYRLMQEYQNAGDYGRVWDVAIDVSEMLSETGRSLQAATIIKKLSPEGRLMSAQRIAKKLSDRLGKDIRLDDETIDQILKARTEAEIVEASQKAGVKIWNQVPSGLQNKANAWRYVSMLMNPKTHIRNIVGSLAFMPARGLKNIIGTGLERMSRVEVGQRTKAIINPLNKSDQALLKLADKDFGEVRNILRGEAKYDDVIRPLEAKVFNTKILEAGRKLNLNLLDGEDIFFMRAAYDSSFAQYMKANKIDINNLDFATLQKARNYAADEALKATYRDYNKLASSISKLKHNLATSPARSTSALWFKRGAGVALEGVLPFTKTPMNLLRRGVEYSPVSLATGVNDMLKAIRKGKVPPAEAIDRLAAGMSGTGILLLGMLLQKQGIVVGGSDNQYSSKQYQWENMTGMQEYAIDTGDGTYTLDWAAPMSMPFFVGVELSKMLGQEEGSFVNIADAITAIDEPIFNMSMLQGINQALNTWSQSEGIGGALGEIGFNMALSYAGQFVPTVGGQIARTADDYRRVTTSTDESATVRKVEREFNRQKGKIPLANKNEPYIDLWGRKESSGGAFQNFISPGYYRPTNETKVDKEIGKLIKSLDSELAKDVIPRVTNSYTITQDKVDYRLSEKELTRFKEVRGKESYNGMNRLINSSAYQKMSPEEKVKAIKKVYDSAYQKAKEELLKKRAAIPTKK